MKKVFILLICLFMIINLPGCKEKTETVERLVIGFTPKTDAEEVQEFSRVFINDIKRELADRNVEVNEIEVVLTSSNESLCREIDQGNIDVGFISPYGYLQYKDSHVKPLLVSLTLDCILESTDLKEVNDNLENITVGKAPGYYAFIYVNSATDNGRYIYDKALKNELKWNDISSLRWYIGSPVSLDTYLMPSLWLNENFGKGFGNSRRTVAELDDVTGYNGYFDMMSALIKDECDVIAAYADMRREIRFDEIIYSRYGNRYEDMYEFIKIIGVTPLIYNDIIVYSSKNIASKYLQALSEVLKNIAEPDESYLRSINIYGFEDIKESDLNDLQDMINLFSK